MIKEARWSGWVWVGECSFWYRPTRVVPDQRPLNGRCRCCCIEEGILATFCSSFISGATNRKPLQLLNVTKQLTVYSTFPSLLPPLPINYGMSFASCCYLTCFVRYWDCRQHCDRAFPVWQLTECTTVLFTEAWLCRAMHCVQPSVTECLL